MFQVLLGPDGAGKSSALAQVRASLPHWRAVSTDDEFLGAEHALIGRLRRHVVRDVLPGLGGAYSAEFLASLLQTAVVHLRDEVLRAAGTPLLMDSYYYKILAKCRLAGIDENPMYEWWRSFPQPARVIYLDVAPETAWRRSGHGARLNPLEHFGDHPGRPGFERYQKGLKKLMLEEVGHLPVTVITEQPDAARTAAAVAEVLDR
jgi:thymidylate kinase